MKNLKEWVFSLIFVVIIIYLTITCNNNPYKVGTNIFSNDTTKIKRKLEKEDMLINLLNKAIEEDNFKEINLCIKDLEKMNSKQIIRFYIPIFEKYHPLVCEDYYWSDTEEDIAKSKEYYLLSLLCLKRIKKHKLTESCDLLVKLQIKCNNLRPEILEVTKKLCK